MELIEAWASLTLLPLAGWLGIRALRKSDRQRVRQAIRTRLSRLPEEFTVLDDLVVPAPWGRRLVDHVILSRYGVVAVSAGMPNGAMCERVEAVRTLLFGARLMGPGFPIHSLILLPPGATHLPLPVGESVPVVRVDHLRLEHLAPTGAPVLTNSQVAEIARCLLGAQSA